MEPSVERAVKGRSGILSDEGLFIMMDERLLPSADKLARFARSQNSFSSGGGLRGGMTFLVFATVSVVITALVGSGANVPICGPLPVFGVPGLESEAEGVLAVRMMTRFGVTGVPGFRLAGELGGGPILLVRSAILASSSSRGSSSVV